MQEVHIYNYLDKLKQLRKVCRTRSLVKSSKSIKETQVVSLIELPDEYIGLDTV